MFVCSEMVENADAAQAMDLLQRFNANVIVNLFFGHYIYPSLMNSFFFFCSHILFLFFLSKVLLREGLKLKKKVT